MITDHRKDQRRLLRYNAWLMLGPEAKHCCMLSDVSDSGACIEVEDSRVFPDQFFLLLSANGAVHRNCHVVWRKPQQLGVKFERAAEGDKQPAAPPRPQATATPEPEPNPEPEPALAEQE